MGSWMAGWVGGWVDSSVWIGWIGWIGWRTRNPNPTPTFNPTPTPNQIYPKDEGLRFLTSKAEIIDELEATLPGWLKARAWFPPFIHILKFHPDR